MRKIRIAFDRAGKSGGGRVTYIDFTVYRLVYLITAYSKKEKDNLSKAEQNTIAKMIVRLEHELKAQEKRR